MEVVTFKLDTTVSVDSDVDVVCAHSRVVPTSQCLMSLLQYEEGLISALSQGGSSITEVPLAGYILMSNHLEKESDEAISTYIEELIPYPRYARQRHILSSHKGIVTSTMYRNVYVHLITKGGGYVGHTLSYDQFSGVGIDDIYISLSQKETVLDDAIPVLMGALGRHVGDRPLIAYDGRSIIASLLSQMEKKK